MKRVFVILTCFSFILMVKAQLYVSPGASLYVDNSVSITLPGDVKNFGNINNTGTLYLKGNLDNQNSLFSSGTIILNGLNQTFFHKNIIISSLVCKGGGVKKFTSSLTIANHLELLDGLVKPDDLTIFMLKSNATTTIGSNYSYVEGKLYTEGLTNRYFPIGKGGLFAPCELQSVKGDSLVVYGVEVINPTSLELKKGKQTQGVLQTRYWKMTTISGTFTQGYASLSYSTDDTFLDPEKVGVVQSNDSIGPYDMLRKNVDYTSKISETGLLYSTGFKPITKRYFTLGDFYLADPKLFFLPNAISQYALDSNDRSFRIYGGIFEKEGFSFVVSNQWGNVVFKSNSVKEMSEKGWDGINNKTLRRETTGQYLYVIKGTTLNGDPFEKAGPLWIID